MIMYAIVMNSEQFKERYLLGHVCPRKKTHIIKIKYKSTNRFRHFRGTGH